MRKRAASFVTLSIGTIVFTCTTFLAQREFQVPTPSGAEQYGVRFFEQLRGAFGRFRDGDLQRVFDNAKPIQCSELVNESGQWRTVAFFNQRRELGNWYRRSFDEVRNDLSTYVFKGVC